MFKIFRFFVSSDAGRVPDRVGVWRQSVGSGRTRISLRDRGTGEGWRNRNQYSAGSDGRQP